MNKNTLTVNIGGREYTLSSSGDEEWTRRVASYVDRKIGEVSLHTSMSQEIAAVVAALSIAEEREKEPFTDEEGKPKMPHYDYDTRLSK